MICTADITGRKAAVEKYLQELQTSVEETGDPEVLDWVLSLLIQASAALKAVSTTPERNTNSFEVKERFAPTQKNEVQLRLWKTIKSPGRKVKHPPMK